MSAPIEGRCDPRFARVRDALAHCFAELGELGAALAISVEGRTVVDLWGGWKDAACSDPWRADTLVNVFSVGKGMTALALLRLVDRGLVDPGAPVARYWPQFAAAGKESVTVSTLASHQGGLPAVREPLAPLSMYDWDRMTSALAAQAPWWSPGSAVGYHVNTFGFLLGEIVRRVSGRSFGAFFRDEIAGPADADFWFGLPAEHDARVAPLQLPDGPLRFPAADPQQALLLERTYSNPPGASGNGTVNTREWRAAVIPSTNAHANARAIARIYTPLACGGQTGAIRLLAKDTLELGIAEQVSGHDVVLDRPSRFALGFQLNRDCRFGPSARSFGHFGAGGSLGFADPDARVALGYSINRMGPRWNNPRVQAVVGALYECIGAVDPA
jgi:CubicO group peptidase (beta-lactamase class C family)